jgi:hypothetical protein
MAFGKYPNFLFRARSLRALDAQWTSMLLEEAQKRKGDLNASGGPPFVCKLALRAGW